MHCEFFLMFFYAICAGSVTTLTRLITIDMLLPQACYIYSPCIAHLASHVLRDLY